MKEALKLALEALTNAIAVRNGEGGTKLVSPLEENAIAAIKEALAQPEQEPVATVTSESGNPDVKMSWWHEPALTVGTKFYTTPPQRPWVGLTDEEISQLWISTSPYFNEDDFAKAVGAKLKEKNT